MTIRGFLVGLLLAGCGGSDESGGGSSGTISDQEADDICDDACAHAIDCGDPDAATCPEDCHDLADLMRADIFRFISDCASELACGESADTCFRQMEDEFATSSSQNAYLDACRARMEDCGVPPASIDQACNGENILMLSDDAVGELDACLDESCPDIGQCIVATVDSWDLG